MELKHSSVNSCFVLEPEKGKLSFSLSNLFISVSLTHTHTLTYVPENLQQFASLLESDLKYCPYYYAMLRRWQLVPPEAFLCFNASCLNNDIRNWLERNVFHLPHGKRSMKKVKGISLDTSRYVLVDRDAQGREGAEEEKEKQF